MRPVMKKWFLRAEKTNLTGNMVGHDAKFKVVYPFYREKSIYPKAFGLLSFLILVLVFLLGTAWAEKVSEETYQKLRNLRIPFITNQGQMDEQVRFYARTFSGTVYVTEEGKVVYELPTTKDKKDRRWVLVEEVLDGLPGKEIQGEGQAETKVSYFLGNDQSKWKSGLTTYEGIDLGEVYEGIKLKLRAYGGSVEKLYYISPRKDPDKIRMKVDGAESLTVNHLGELEVQTGNGPVIFSRPRAFQQEGGKREDVEVAYLVKGDSYGFKVGPYDETKELVIDPLIQSTYLGGSGSDQTTSLAISGGNVYVAGYTNSSPFPGTTGGSQPAFGGGSYDGFVSVLSGDLTTLVRSTYLGGSGYDGINSLTVSEGNVYVAGYTGSTNFPGTTEGYQPAFGGGTSDGFVSLLSGNLTTLVRSTYLGGGGDDWINFLAISGGNVYAVGPTGSTNFPGTTEGAQAAYGGGTDGFVSLMSGDLTTLIQSTYLGGSGYDAIDYLIVSEENVYVSGTTFSSNIPGTTGGYQPDFGGAVDAFVSLLSGDLKTLIQSTYLGGSANENSRFLAFSGGNIYLAGVIDGTDLPGTGGGAQSVIGGGTYMWDGFVSLLSEDLKTLIQSTYLGGGGNDYIYSLALSGGNVYVAGATDSSPFPGTPGGFQPAFGGGSYDGFVSLLSGDLYIAS